MADYCLDSNVVSDILRGDSVVIDHMEVAKKNNDTLFIPSIVYYEIVRGLKAAGKKNKFLAFQLFYDEAEHLSLDTEAIDKAVEIYVKLHNGQMLRTMTFTLRQFPWSTGARSSLPTFATSAASKV